MIFPVNKPHRIGFRFGSPYGGVLARLLGPKHMGVDLIPETKEPIPILAIDNATVIRRGPLGSCGLSVDYVTDTHKVRVCHLESITAQPGEIGAGKEIGIMGATGVSSPKNFRHLHWAMWKKGVMIDPLSLTYTNTVPSDTYNIAKEFKSIWRREPAKGELAYLTRRVDRKTIADLKDLRNKLRYWRDTVYPKGIYSFTGDARWQLEKVKGV